MSAPIDHLHFTSLRFRSVSFDELLPKLTDAVAKEYTAKGVIAHPKIFLHSKLPDTVIIENVVASEESIPQTHPKLYVDTLCAAAVLRGSDIFAPGVVGMEPEAAAATEPGLSVSVFACLGKFNAGFKRTYDGPAVFLGNGRLALPARQLLGNIHANSGVAVSMTQPLCSCPSFHSELFLTGCLVAQNLPSLVCARVVGAQPGELVLDMCAAPGGKCIHLADLMLMMGSLIAVDKSAKRLQSVAESAARFGISGSGFLRLHCLDSCRLCDPDGTDAFNPAALPPYRPRQFDRVLLDAPCSALGQRPRLSCGDVDSSSSSCHRLLDSFAPLQRRLLRTASELVKPGGTLVYSTCTTRQEENESQVLWALANLPRLRLAEQSPNLRPLRLVPDCPDVQKFTMPSSGETELDCDHDTIGFFIAKFVAADMP